MPRTLFGKLLLVVLLFCLLMTTVCIFLMRAWHSHYHAQVDQIVGKSIAQDIVRTIVPNGANGATKEFGEEFLQEVVQANPSMDAYYLSGDGKILAASVPENILQRKFVDTAPIREFLQPDPEFPILGADPRQLSSAAVFSAASFPSEKVGAGYLYLVLHSTDSASGLAAFKLNHAINETISILIVSALLALMATLVVMRVLTTDLSRLEAVMSEFRASGFEKVPEIGVNSVREGGDEVRRLTCMFRELALKLNQRMRELVNIDHSRREMLANISHDLGTPLATIMAQVETMLLAPNMSKEERTHYLEKSLRQCQSLANMVDQLLEIARLDAKAVPFDPEAFSVGELLHDVALKFQPKADAAQVNIKVADVSDLPLAEGDIGLIERALDNLLNNAIDHAGAGISIVLSAVCVDNEIRVSVEDNGIGMAKDMQAHVKERFYQGDSSRWQVGKHTGLGLAIVSGIANLHRGDLQLQSEAGIGTCASFTLPVA